MTSDEHRQLLRDFCRAVHIDPDEFFATGIISFRGVDVRLALESTQFASGVKILIDLGPMPRHAPPRMAEELLRRNAYLPHYDSYCLLGDNHLGFRALVLLGEYATGDGLKVELEAMIEHAVRDLPDSLHADALER